MYFHRPAQGAITVQWRQEGTFLGWRGCRVNYSKAFSRATEGDPSVSFYTGFLKSYNTSLHSFEPYQLLF